MLEKRLNRILSYKQNESPNNYWNWKLFAKDFPGDHTDEIFQDLVAIKTPNIKSQEPPQKYSKLSINFYYQNFQSINNCTMDEAFLDRTKVFVEDLEKNPKEKKKPQKATDDDNNTYRNWP